MLGQGRPAFFNAAVIWAIVSFAEAAGVGALASNASTSEPVNVNVPNW